MDIRKVKTIIINFHAAICVLLGFYLLSMSAVIYAADGPGTTSMVILKQTMGPRAIALGDTFVAVADDVSTLQYNPAGLISLQAMELTGILMKKYRSVMNYQYTAFVIPDKNSKESFNNIDIIDSMSKQQEDDQELTSMKRSILAMMTRDEFLEYTREQIRLEEEAEARRKSEKQKIGVVKEKMKYAFGASFMSFNAGEMTVEYENPLEPSQTFASAQNDYIITVAGALGNDRCGAGINLKYIGSTFLETYSVSDVAMDIGCLYMQNIGESLSCRLGACIQNVGPKVGYNEFQYMLPTTSRLGMSIKFNTMKMIQFNLDVMPAVEWVSPVDSHGQLHAGCEISTELREESGDRMMIRGGYKTGRDINSYGIIGVGLRISSFQVDVSYVPLELIKFDLGGLEEELMVALTLRF